MQSWHFPSVRKPSGATTERGTSHFMPLTSSQRPTLGRRVEREAASKRHGDSGAARWRSTPHKALILAFTAEVLRIVI